MISRTKRTSSLVAALVVAASACKSSPNPDDLNRIIDQRLANRGLAPLPSPSASSAPGKTPRAPATDGDPAGRSIAFIDKLDELMKDYKPELPVVEDKSDALRCVTTDAANNNQDVKRIEAVLRSQKEAVKQARARKEHEFYDAMYPLAFHYDLDWQTRKAPPVSPTYGCWVTSADPQTRVERGEWVDISANECQRQFPWGLIGGRIVHPPVWKIRSSGHASSLFVHSNSETPPDQPPELMRRIDAANLKPPDRFTCRVDDVVPAQDHKIVKCRSPGQGATLRISGTLPAANIGDVVSVPLANTRRDPDGVLFKGVGAKGGWTVDADGSSMTVDSAASCPSMDEIRVAIGTTGEKR